MCLNCWPLHLAAERALLPKCFAFDHVNYCRYLSVRHVNLHAIRIQKKDEWEDFLHNGFGGSLSGERFSTIHGDLITETTINRGESQRRSNAGRVQVHQRKQQMHLSKLVTLWRTFEVH